MKHAKKKGGKPPAAEHLKSAFEMGKVKFPDQLLQYVPLPVLADRLQMSPSDLLLRIYEPHDFTIREINLLASLSGIEGRTIFNWLIGFPKISAGQTSA